MGDINLFSVEGKVRQLYPTTFKFDEHAVNQMQKNIKLIKYKKFGDELILFEQINSPAVKLIEDSVNVQQTKKSTDKTFAEQLEGAGDEFREIYFSIRDYFYPSETMFLRIS